MKFEEAHALLREVLIFLHKAGGPYADMRGRVAGFQTDIILCLSVGQYIVERDEKGITGFGCWWNVTEDDLREALGGCVPADFVTGPVLYVCHAASTTNIRTLFNAISRRVRHGFAWYRRKGHIKLHYIKDYRHVSKNP